MSSLFQFNPTKYTKLLCYILFIHSFCNINTITAQTKVFQPKPIKIDLGNINESVPKNLDKQAKKEWRNLRKTKKKNLKSLNVMYAEKFDSIQHSLQKNHDRLKYLPDTSTLLNSGHHVFTSYQREYLGDDYLSLFFDSTYVQDQRLAISDSLFKRQNLQWKQQLTILKKKYGIPDSLPLTSQLDSVTLQGYKDGQFAKPLDEYVQNDSVYHQYANELGMLNDSLRYNYVAMTEDLLTEKLQQRFNEQVVGGLQGFPDETGDILTSYEEIIQADRYKQMMADIPGKKLELEERIKNPEALTEDLPNYGKHFSGKYKILATAKKELEVVKKKHTFRDYLKYLFDQEMEPHGEKKLTQRFNLSGYLQISGQKPLLLDYSPSIAYNATGKVAVGFGINGRLKFGQEPTEEEDLIGYRSFVEYKIMKKTYIHGEFERTGLLQTDPVTEHSARIWSRRWLLGIGRDFKHRSGIMGSLLVLYNFNNDEEGPHSKTFQVRYGIKI